LLLPQILLSVIIVAAQVLAPRGIQADTYEQAATVLSAPFGRWGFTLFCASCSSAASAPRWRSPWISPTSSPRRSDGIGERTSGATVPSLAGFDPLAPRRQAATRRRDGSRPHVLAIRVLPFSIGSMRLPLKLFRHVGAHIELDVDGHSDRRLLRAEKWPTRHVVENIPGTQG
jgi:hypothetical protein